MRIYRWLVGGLSLAAAACGTEPESFRVGCSGIDVVEVGQGLSPRMSWSPTCSVARLRVYEAIPRVPSEDPVPPLPGEHPDYLAGQLLWAIASLDGLGNRLDPGLVYAEVPGNAIEQVPSLPLQAGQPYLVRLTVLSPDGGDDLGAWGVFTP